VLNFFQEKGRGASSARRVQLPLDQHWEEISRPLNLCPGSRRKACKEDIYEPSDLVPIPNNHWIRKRCTRFKPLDIHTFDIQGLEQQGIFGSLDREPPVREIPKSHAQISLFWNLGFGSTRDFGVTES
jgi:hypothetical protein